MRPVDPRVIAVAEAVYLQAGLSPSQSPYISMENAHTFWPGWEARKFVAMMEAFQKATTAVEAGSVGIREADETQTPTVKIGGKP